VELKELRDRERAAWLDFREAFNELVGARLDVVEGHGSDEHLRQRLAALRGELATWEAAVVALLEAQP
jgi:hypothetical protein